MSTIVTLGHSNRTLEQLVALLRAHRIELVVDIRRVPRSGRNPQFDAGLLAIDLPDAGIRYRSVPELGGRRSRRPDSPHVGLTDPSIAGYADYMDSDAFADVAGKLIDVAGRYRTGIMCAEAKPEGCHRRLLCDWLVANGVDVIHAVDADTGQPHAVTESARLDGGRVVYDRVQLSLI
jgi:uncharacterized protein (DUF488 family)